jgi:hypothetical protein
VAQGFYIGDYKSAQKRMNDHIELTLEFDGILYYQMIVEVMTEIDKVDFYLNLV